MDLELDILAFGAHPDDVEFSCSGTMTLMHRKGLKTGIVDLTRGELGTRGSAHIRTRESQNASKIMGVTVRKNLGLPDGNIEVNQKNILKAMAPIREYRPRIVIAPYHTDRHPDHEHCSRLIREAVYYAGLRRIRTNSNGEQQAQFRPEMTLYYRQSGEMPVSIVVDITSVFDEKMQAVYAYASQVYNPKAKVPDTIISRPEFIDNIEAHARVDGSRIGVKYGEAFYCSSPIWSDNLFALIPQQPRMM